MNTKKRYTKKAGLTLLSLLCAALIVAGCGGGDSSDNGPPKPQVAYDNGYEDGFLDDAEYFLGYDDSFLNETVDATFYQGDLIPFIEEISYAAGFWDGQFDAYNDGYFVAYRYAFIIGFSEGYDNAFWSDYLDFLANDWHVELLHAGFSDGYNDGFSEGRIFGAADYEANWAFNWLDAFRDWESGTDLYFEEVDKGTGIYGPVILYEWGQNPLDLNFATSQARTQSYAIMRANPSKGTRSTAPNSTIDLARTLSTEQEAALNVSPDTTSRTNRPLTLITTWGERIDSYQQQPLASVARSDQRSRSEGKRGI